MLTRKASWRSVDYIYFMWMKRATHLSSPKRQWLYRMRMTMILVTNTSTMMRLNRCLRDTQCCQPVQIICICPDICAFSVLDNRHCADICTICQKCQFEVRKGWQVLLLQSKAEDMYCNHAALPYWNFHLSKLQWNKYITWYHNRLMWYLLSFVVAWAMGYVPIVPFTRVLTQILRRYLDQKSAADSSAHQSDCCLLLQETKKIWLP